MANDKVLVSNRTALRSKYGVKGLKKIEKGLDALIQSDAERGVATRLIYLDRSADMKPLKARRVTKAGDRKQAKRAIDGVFAALEPAYLVILGAPDVVPHQSLRNPVDDEDGTIPSDLPYASAAPFSTRPEDFTMASRVVSRLPGVRGNGDPSYLLSLLKNAAAWTSRSRPSYESYFAVSAEVWKGSTRKSVRKLFGTTKSLDLSPPEGPRWTQSKLQRRTHFFNLHGALEDENFYGEDDGEFPDAHQALYLEKRVRVGTVVAAECCYGAELYDPESAGLHMGIANTYLGGGAHAFFGSTTVAYGPEDENGAADLICQSFIKDVLRGASVGRAALQARQSYVAENGPIDPIDLKTLAQFHLLGDASIHPVRTVKTSKAVKPGAKSPLTRKMRRSKLTRRAQQLEMTTASVGCAPKRGAPGKLREKIARFAKRHAMDVGQRIERFAIQAPKKLVGKSPSVGSYFLIYGKRPEVLAKSRRRGQSAIAGRRPVLVVREENGKIGNVRRFVPR